MYSQRNKTEQNRVHILRDRTVAYTFNVFVFMFDKERWNLVAWKFPQMRFAAQIIPAHTRYPTLRNFVDLFCFGSYRVYLVTTTGLVVAAEVAGRSVEIQRKRKALQMMFMNLLFDEFAAIWLPLSFWMNGTP